MERNFNLLIPQKLIKKYNSLMDVDFLDYQINDIPRYSLIDCWGIDCGGGYEVDLKVCSSDDGDPLWCEAVLFYKGSERACTEVYDNLCGDWGLYCDGISFCIHVDELPTAKEIFRISADGGDTWTEQWLTDEEAREESKTYICELTK